MDAKGQQGKGLVRDRTKDRVDKTNTTAKKEWDMSAGAGDTPSTGR